MKKIALISAAALLAGCMATTRQPEPQVVEVFKVVRAPCVEKAPDKPVYLYGKGPMPDEKTRGAIMIKDLEAAQQYGTEWEAAAAGCVKPVVK